jgi:hypothetical protein
MLTAASRANLLRMQSKCLGNWTSLPIKLCGGRPPKVRTLMRIAPLIVLFWLSNLAGAGQDWKIQGRPIESWIEDWGRSQTREAAEQALIRDSANTVRILLEMAFTQDGPEERKQFEKLDPEGLRHYGFTPKVYNLHQNAGTGFAMIGSNAIEAVPELTRLFLDFRTHNDGISILTYIGDPAVGPLDRVLATHKNSAYRNGAAIALGLCRFNATPAVPTLVKALNDETFDVRLSAANSLGNIRLDRKDLDASLIVPALARALSDKSSLVRKASAESLIKFGDSAKSAVPALLKATQDKVPDVKYEAAIAVGYIAPEEAKKVIPVLLKAASVEEWDVANSAVSILRKIAPEEAAKAKLEIRDPFAPAKPRVL